MSIGEHRQFFALNSFDSTRFIEPLGWEPVLTMLCHFLRLINNVPAIQIF